MIVTAQISLLGPADTAGTRNVLMDAFEVTGPWAAVMQTVAELPEGFEFTADTQIVVDIVTLHPEVSA